VAGLLAWFGGFFPVLRRLTGVQAAVIAATSAKIAAVRAGVSLDSVDPANPVARRPLPGARAEPQDIFSIEAETVQTLVASDPARTAQVIRGWIAGDRGSPLKREK
jgi:flagellar biosynthesis/type III secretory pathway M-ring protein FliF/YscJ